MAADDDTKPEDKSAEHLSRKEFAKRIRHETYQRAKEYRATDPKQIAMKEGLKLRRREAYQAAKARAKALKSERQKRASEMVAQDRDARDCELMETMVPANKLKPAPRSR